MPSRSAPFPPPTSTIVPSGVKSYAAATATAVIFVKSAIAAWKLAACTGSFAISAKASAAPRLRYAGSPVRTHHSRSFHESWMPIPAKRRTMARELPGTSARRHSPSAVSAKPPSSFSSNTPTAREEPHHAAERRRVGLRRFAELLDAPGAGAQQVGDAELRDDVKRAREVVADRHLVQKHLRRHRGPLGALGHGLLPFLWRHSPGR